MSLRALVLDTLHLANLEHRLELSVISAADIRIPQSVSNLEDFVLVKALTSGNLWVSRGIACHLDIQVLFNGKPLDRSLRVTLLESLGYRLRDAQLWSQLLLSASFDVWQNDDAADSIPDLSININHGLETRTPHSRNRAWELDNFDIKPPDSVLCAQFERVQIRFEFLEIPKKAKRVKRAKPDTTKFDAEEEMLLDFELTLGTHREMDELAHVVEEMRGLSGLIARCFEPQLEVDDEPNLLQRTPLSTLVPRGSDLESPSVQALAESISGNGRSNRVRIRQHPKAAIEILSAWFQAHTDNPYPTKTEKLELVRNTGLNTRQVNVWLTNKRQRRLVGPENADGEMLLAQSKDDGSVQELGDQEEDDMLLSQTTNKTPSLTSQTSSGSSIVTVGEKELSLKRASPSDEAISLDKSSACELGEAAIHILISGYIGRSLRGTGGIQVEKPPPSLSLASITPSTFCPGFKESMARNAHFLPTISHAISISWLRNIQSPSLRAKLGRLANSPTSALTNASRIENGEKGTAARLAAVVQSRLWSMMQRTSYDPSDAAKIWKKSTLQDVFAEEHETPDLLGTLEEQNIVKGRVVTELGEFEEDDLDVFEDLLLGDDDELLEYMEARERLSVERETEEMLFGVVWDEDPKDEEDACLLDGEAGGDIMLL